MAKSESDSALVSAAEAFDTELVTYARLGELLLKTPLTTLKHLQRARDTLIEIESSEQRLQTVGKQLVEAISGVRQQQEQLSKKVIDYAPSIHARHQTLSELMTSLTALAGEISEVNGLVASVNETAAEGAARPDTADVSTKVLALSERAQQLSTRCHDVDFEELGEQAHALHQRLKAIGTKLQKAGGN